jgi:16S rRNA (guanine966-N2)-methyltransferase
MKLLSPKTDVSRPIIDRVKESLFSVLYNYDLPDGKIVADLFCGVGSLGLEALSRGAKFVTFIEKDPNIIATLETNIEKANFVDRATIVRADAFKIAAPPTEQPYDLVFVDPPYADTAEIGDNSPLSKLLAMLIKQLAPDGTVVVRTRKNIQLLEQYDQLHVTERRQWGTMAVTILQKTNK